MTQLFSRRRFSTGLAALGATPLLPRSGQAAINLNMDEARREGSVTWYVASVDTETAEHLGRAFTDMYPGIRVTAVRTTGQVAYERLLQELKNNTPQCDVFSSTDISHYPALKKRNALAVFRPQGAETMMPAFRALSDPGYYYPSTSGAHILIYNNMRVKPEEAPKSWLDLLDPKWKNRVATGHPAFSGCTGLWTLGLKKAYGWQYFEKLAKNNPRIGRSGIDPVTLITAGECLVGPAPVASSFIAVDKGNPITPVYPTDGASLCVGPAAVMANAPHPNAARVFMEWLVSEDYSRLAVEKHGDPVHAGMTLKSGQKSLDQVPVMSLTVDEISKGVPEVIEQWRDTFGA